MPSRSGEATASVAAVRSGKWLVLGQLVLLAITAVIAFVVAEIWLLAIFFPVELYSSNPAYAAGVLLLYALVLFLCVRGAALASVRIVYFASRAILLLLSAAAGILSVEFVYGGLVSLGVTGLTGSLESYFWLGVGLALVALSAAGIRHAFGWRVRYWIVLLGVSALVLLGIFIAASDFILMVI